MPIFPIGWFFRNVAVLWKANPRGYFQRISLRWLPNSKLSCAHANFLATSQMHFLRKNINFFLLVRRSESRIRDLFLYQCFIHKKETNIYVFAKLALKISGKCKRQLAWLSIVLGSIESKFSIWNEIVSY